MGGKLEDAELELGELETVCVRQWGALCWCCCGLVALSILVSTVPVSGVTDVPAYARTLLYLSVGWHFDDVSARVSEQASPPPPSF